DRRRRRDRRRARRPPRPRRPRLDRARDRPRRGRAARGPRAALAAARGDAREVVARHRRRTDVPEEADRRRRDRCAAPRDGCAAGAEAVACARRLAAFAGLLAGAFLLLRAAWRRDRLTGLGLAAAFATLLVQSFVYSGFFEDPVMWGSLAVAGLYGLPREEGLRDLLARLAAWRPSRLQAVVGAVALALVAVLVGAVVAARLHRPSSGRLVTGATDVTVS